MKDPKETTQEERQEHLRSLGWSEESIELVGEIPYHVMFISRRPLTEAQREYARTLRPSAARRDDAPCVSQEESASDRPAKQSL